MRKDSCTSTCPVITVTKNGDLQRCSGCRHALYCSRDCQRTILGKLHSVVIKFRAWTNGKCLATKHHQTLLGDQTFYRLDTSFGAVWSCLVVFDKILGPSNIRSKTLNISFVLVFEWRCFVRLDNRVSNMFDAGMRTTLPQRLVSIV